MVNWWYLYGGIDLILMVHSDMDVKSPQLNETYLG